MLNKSLMVFLILYSILTAGKLQFGETRDIGSLIISWYYSNNNLTGETQ